MQQIELLAILHQSTTVYATRHNTVTAKALNIKGYVHIIPNATTVPKLRLTIAGKQYMNAYTQARFEDRYEIQKLLND